jgi:pilus assembly protein CpaF
MQDVFRFEDEGDDDNGKVKGNYKPTGLRPYYSDRLKTHGYNLPASFFMQNTSMGPDAGGGRGRFGGRRR